MPRLGETAYTTASVMLGLLLISQFFLFIFTLVDYNGGTMIENEAGTVIGTLLFFGTGTYYVVLLSAPFLLISIFCIACYMERRASARNKDVYLTLTWPLFTNDLFSNLTLFLVTWGLQLSLLVPFMVKYGYGTNVDVAPGTFNSEHVDRYMSNTFFLLCTLFSQVAIVLDMLYVYTLRIYEPSPHTIEVTVAPEEGRQGGDEYDE